MEEEILKEIEETENNKPANEIVEIDENEEITNTQYDMEKVTPKKDEKKSKKPSKWSTLSKKTKIIIIVSIILVLIIAIVLIYFLVLKKDNNKNENNDPVVVIEKDNYKYEDGKLIFIDKDKKEIGSYDCTNKNENLCFVAYFSNEDNFDVNKKVYESGLPINIRTDIIKDKYVFIYDDETKEKGNVILYDMSSNKKLEEYSLVKEVKDNYVIVKKDNDYKLISLDSSLEDAIKTTYDYMGYIEDTNYLVVASNGNYKLIDFDDKDVSKTVPGNIMSFDDKNISVKVSNEYYVYDYSGKVVVNDKYDYIRFANNYIIAASGKKLFVYDVNGNRMNIEGIRITSDSYNTKLIFNDNLRQVGKEEAFNVVVSNNIMRIEYGEDYTKINLSDGIVSKNIPYISYFGDKLYFYSDEEKSNLIGSYKCEYANDIDESTKELQNCFIAKESNIFTPDKEVKNGYLPIYNNNYVFISDTKSPNANDNIILWDLKNNKKLATYKSVDAGFHDTENTVNFITTGGTQVVAKNTSDSYGLINIQTSKVNGIIPFKDQDDAKLINVSFKLLQDNYLVKRSDETYHLYNKKGNEIASKVSTKYEIVEYKYNHLKVKNSDKYLIYDLNGKIVSDEFKNIFMENNFYLSIDSSNILHVFKYENKKDLMSEEVTINDIEKDLNYEVKNDLLIITNPNDVGSTIKVFVG